MSHTKNKMGVIGEQLEAHLNAVTFTACIQNSVRPS